MTHDPLSSQGIQTALECGLKCGSVLRSVIASKGGERGIEEVGQEEKRELKEYYEMVRTMHEKYEEEKCEFYGKERRFEKSEFWKRRHKKGKLTNL